MSRRVCKSDVKCSCSTAELHLKLRILRVGEVIGIPSVAVKCVEIGKNTSGEADYWTTTDADTRKRGEQTGLDTLVVHAVNDEC